MAAPPAAAMIGSVGSTPSDSGQEGKRAERGQHDPGGQAVETVDQVDRVDDQDDPADGQRQRQPAEMDDAPRHVEAIEAQPEREGEHSRDDLPEELHERRHAADVVDDADHDQESRPGQDRRGTVRPQDADRVQVVRRHRREGERHGEGDGDRHAAEPRHRELVDLALGVRLVEQAVPDGEEAHERGDRQAHD